MIVVRVPILLLGTMLIYDAVSVITRAIGVAADAAVLYFIFSATWKVINGIPKGKTTPSFTSALLKNGAFVAI